MNIDDRKLVERDKKLYKHLLEKGLVQKEALDVSVAEIEITNSSLGLALVKNGFIHQKKLIDSLLHLSDDSLGDESTYPSQVPPEVWLDNNAMCIAIAEQHVYVSTLTSQDSTFKALRHYFPAHEIKFIAADFQKIGNYHGNLSRMHGSDLSHLERIISKAVHRGASDIHIIPRGKSFSIMFREMGVLGHFYEGEIDEYQTLNARIKNMSSIDIAEMNLPKDGSFSIEHSGRYIDLRVATSPMTDGEVLIIRILDPEKTKDNLNDLGISGVPDWRKGVNRRHGICLICGPTGSGKTTTLNATVRELNRFEKAIYSAEDPVEYNIPFIRQININEAIGLTYSSVARAFMRQDPDVILLGEIRDLETAKHAIKAAETGHLVIATLHTSSISRAVKRLADLGVEEHEMKDILRSVMAQNLIRLTCQQCQKNDPKCSRCNGKGYSSVSVVSEVKYFSKPEEIQALIDNEPPTWRTMLEDAYDKLLQGLTDEDELKRVFPTEFEDMLEDLSQNQKEEREKSNNSNGEKETLGDN